MKNLKKLNRVQQKEIQGGGPIKRCDYSYECPGGACCNHTCMYNPCYEQ
ncbi:hypothetical protein M2347_002699 [Chryseobacterium sp. H1D6B]|nr:hypothetical protein [Chryseobacterium sp. H1D6B]MDH6252972.1 hypothetical protein [Chryseobacterium sp. H1D6B]